MDIKKLIRDAMKAESDVVAELLDERAAMDGEGVDVTLLKIRMRIEAKEKEKE